MSSAVEHTLPKGWVEKKLKDKEVCELIMGQSPSSDTYNTEGKGMPFFQGKKEFGDISPVVEKYCTSPKKIAFPGDILMSVRAPVGPTNIANIECCIGRGLAAIRPNLDFTLKNYLLYYFKNFEVEISKKGKGSTFTAITKNALEESVIPLPPLQEQKHIVTKIDGLFAKIDKAITLTEESLVQANNLLPSVLKEVFEKGKEDGWEEAKLGQVLRIERGGSPRPIKDYITEDENGLNWIKIGDATNSISDKYIYETKQRIKPEGLYKTRLVKEGDFILSNSMSFGKPYIMKTEGCIHDGWLSLKILDSSCLETDFLYYVLSSPIIYSKFRFLSSGTTVKNLNKAIVASVPISFPRLDEQKEIVSMLDGISNQSKETQYKLEEQLAYLKQLKSSILSKAFKGEL